MSIARNAFLSLSLAILLGTPTSVFSASVGYCAWPSHRECNDVGICRCVIVQPPAKSSGATANPAGGTTPPRRVKGTTNPPVTGTQQK
jgi:hypothetical protein